MKHPKVTKSDVEYECPFFTVKKDHLVFENGAEWDYVYLSSEDGVSTVALDEENNVVLLREYRYPLGQEIYGVPSGGVEGFDSALEAAQAELKEEAGLVAESWQQIGYFYASPGSANHRGNIFLARDLKPAEAHIEEYEQIEVVKMPFEEAVVKVHAGEILDAWAVVPILRVAEYLRAGE